MTPDEELLTTGQVAAKFRMTTGTIRRWVRSGLLKAAFETPAGQLRFRASDVREAIAKGEAAVAVTTKQVSA